MERRAYRVPPALDMQGIRIVPFLEPGPDRGWCGRWETVSPRSVLQFHELCWFVERETYDDSRQSGILDLAVSVYWIDDQCADGPEYVGRGLHSASGDLSDQVVGAVEIVERDACLDLALRILACGGDSDGAGSGSGNLTLASGNPREGRDVDRGGRRSGC